MDTTRFDLIALLFTGLALLGLPRLVRGWRELLAPQLSEEGKALAVYVAVFLAVPIATMAHELGHLVVARALGATDATLHYRVFWGFVDYATRLPGQGDWWVALAGNAVSWALAALGLLASGWAMPPALRYTAHLFGLLEMIHTLVAYPLLSLSSLPGADWSAIYGQPFWAGTWVVAAVHAASLLWLRRVLRAYPGEQETARGEPTGPEDPGVEEENHEDTEVGEGQPEDTKTRSGGLQG
jgi:hypothetical protein